MVRDLRNGEVNRADSSLLRVVKMDEAAVMMRTSGG
jgi:hypothetical protein